MAMFKVYGIRRCTLRESISMEIDARDQRHAAELAQAMAVTGLDWGSPDTSADPETYSWSIAPTLGEETASHWEVDEDGTMDGPFTVNSPSVDLDHPAAPKEGVRDVPIEDLF